MRELLPAPPPKRPWTPPCHLKATAADLFLIARRADGYSAGTLDKYRTGLQDLSAYARANGFPEDLLEFEPAHIRAWVGDLRERANKRSSRRLSPATQWTYWMSVKMFFAWAAASVGLLDAAA